MHYCIWSLRIFDFELSFLRKGVQASDFNYVGITIGRFNFGRNPYIKGRKGRIIKFMK